MHYNRLRRNGDPLVRTRSCQKRVAHLKCIVDGCDNRQAGRGLCKTHHQQWKRRGDPEAPRLKGRDWTEAELARIDLILDGAADGLAIARPGEVEELALLIGRTKFAVSTKLHKRRRERKQLQTAEILSRATR